MPDLGTRPFPKKDAIWLLANSVDCSDNPKWITVGNGLFEENFIGETPEFYDGCLHYDHTRLKEDTAIIFDRAIIEAQAGMSAATARARYSKDSFSPYP